MSNSSDTDNDHNGVMLEQIIHQNEILLEQMGNMRENINRIPALGDDVRDVKSTLQAIKVAVTDTNLQVHDQDERITRLEHQAV